MPFKDRNKYKEYMRIYMRKKRNGGTNDFSEHMFKKSNGKPDFKKEYKLIQKEKRRLGLIL